MLGMNRLVQLGQNVEREYERDGEDKPIAGYTSGKGCRFRISCSLY